MFSEFGQFWSLRKLGRLKPMSRRNTYSLRSTLASKFRPRCPNFGLSRSGFAKTRQCWWNWGQSRPNRANFARSWPNSIVQFCSKFAEVGLNRWRSHEFGRLRPSSARIAQICRTQARGRPAKLGRSRSSLAEIVPKSVQAEPTSVGFGTNSGKMALFFNRSTFFEPLPSFVPFTWPSACTVDPASGLRLTPSSLV